MRFMWPIFIKEILDNIRDRRAILPALVIGPMAMNALFMVIISFSIELGVTKAEEEYTLPVVGAELAPNILQYLRQNKILIVSIDSTEAEAREMVKSGKHDIVLVIPNEFNDTLREGMPATVKMILDWSNNRSTKSIRRVQQLINRYSQKISNLRLQLRGIHPYSVRPIVIENVDVSTPSGRSFYLLMMIPYFLIFSTLMGGLHLAIDATAGERERGSLESLLTLPISRRTIVMGKIFAACVFMSLALLISVTTFVFAASFLPTENTNLSVNLDAVLGMKIGLIMWPFVIFGSSLVTFVASFTKTYKEAQTYVLIVLLLLIMPSIFISFFSLKPTLWLMLVPSLSQSLLIISLFKAEAIQPLFVVLSVTSTVLIGFFFAWLVTKRYQRESILR